SGIERVPVAQHRGAADAEIARRPQHRHAWIAARLRCARGPVAAAVVDDEDAIDEGRHGADDAADVLGLVIRRDDDVDDAILVHVVWSCRPQPGRYPPAARTSR